MSEYKFLKRNISIRFIGLLLSGVIIFSCTDSEDETNLIGNWTKSSDFEGIARNEAVSFVVDDYAYVGTGYNGKKSLADFWKFDVENKYWTQVADFPGAARYSAVGFAIGSKGYIGTGYDGDNYMKDFWEYNPVTNTWTEKTAFGGSARYGAVGFSLTNKGFISTGYDGNYLKDLWEYDPSNDTWSQKVSLGGTKRREASAFVINDKAYLLAGINNGSLVNDFWRYDNQTGNWTELRKISNYSDESYDDEYSTISRYNGVTFASGDKGYIALGTSSSLSPNVWEYNPVTDLWTERTGFEGTLREGSVGFYARNKFFITTGRSSGYQLDDTWEFKPSEEYDDKN